jgi:hypothetical protein
VSLELFCFLLSSFMHYYTLKRCDCFTSLKTETDILVMLPTNSADLLKDAQEQCTDMI